MPYTVKKTLDQIKFFGNDYAVKVKRNQPNLLREMEKIKLSGLAWDSYTKTEKNRGRIEKRSIKTYNVNRYISENWPSAKTVVYLKRVRVTKKGTAVTHSYYLSSLKTSAREFAKGIRHHWGIENRLHYVKDVTLYEDKSKIRSENAPAVLSLIRNLVINIARINGENRIKKFIRQCSGNISLISNYLE